MPRDIRIKGTTRWVRDVPDDISDEEIQERYAYMREPESAIIEGMPTSTPHISTTEEIQNKETIEPVIPDSEPAPIPPPDDPALEEGGIGAWLTGGDPLDFVKMIMAPGVGITTILLDAAQGLD